MIVVYGATGTTGTLVAEELSRRGARLALAGRDPVRLETLARRLGGDVEVRVAPVHDAAALADALRGARAVVSCAGPFLRVGEPVVRAAVEAGVHYVDTTGEQAFVRDIYERYESAARRAGVAVVNACAYEVALGDWAASVAAAAFPDAVLDEITVAYAIEDLHPTRGTQLSALAALSAPGVIWDHDRWDRVTPAAERRDVTFPEPFGVRPSVSFPSPEVITVPRHIDVRRVQTYVSLFRDPGVARAAGAAASLLSPALPALLSSPLGALARARAQSAQSGAALDETRFAITCEASCQFRRSRVSIAGRNIYRVTADIAATAAEALASGTVHVAGVLAPSQVLAPEPSLRAVARRCDLSVSIT